MYACTYVCMYVCLKISMKNFVYVCMIWCYLTILNSEVLFFQALNDWAVDYITEIMVPILNYMSKVCRVLLCMYVYVC